jgi:uncharacterized membrane protein YraQ (UPF0718 family)
MEQIFRIFEFILKSFLHIWPYLLVTIPLAVVINLSGASKYITRAFGKNLLLSVLLATIVGAFSPFCSCGVIPVISSLLIGGVPLAPVMSFWIASPSMDPEIFFLSSSVIGWNLAIWRLGSTFVISLLAGYITHFATIKGFIGNDVLKTRGERKPVFIMKPVSISSAPVIPASINSFCCPTVDRSLPGGSCGCGKTQNSKCNSNDLYRNESDSKWSGIFVETMKASFMVAKFMGVAFLVTALITFYLPEDIVKGIVSGSSTKQGLLATLIGIPMYTSNITGLPIAGGLIDLGLNKGAALSFLIAGATTTLPAMIAVWGITKRRVYFLYLSFALFGSMIAGLCFNLFN